MEKFTKVYPFTTENIAGYMNDIDLKNKKIITVNGSGDHILNAILKGAKDITSFDINLESLEYTKDKINSILSLSYEEFITLFLYDLENNQLYQKYKMEFKYFNPQSKIQYNLYLTKANYEKLKKLIKDTNITYIHANFQNLNITNYYDIMFLSNISDYLNLMYQNDELIRYYQQLLNYLKNIDTIYMAYLYDIGNKNPRSSIDDLNYVKTILKRFTIQKFTTALEEKNTQDGVLILKRSDYYGK